jgi:cell division transport system permease protein
VKYRGLKRSLTDFKRHPWLHVMSISTISVALIIIGAFLLCLRNFNYVAEKTSPQITGTFYLKEELSAVDVQRLKEKILSLEHVKKVVFKPKRSVVEELQVFLGGSSTEILPGGELFPDVYEIELKKDTSPSEIGIIKSILHRFPEAAEVDFSDDWLAQYKRVQHLLTWVGFILMAGVIIGCTFIIANFMGMRHQQRKNEIEIVNLIGAHRNFILSPFLWEGAIEGVLGALVSLVILYFGQFVASTLLHAQWVNFLSLQSWLFLSLWQMGLVVVLGVMMALFGGVTVFWRFQENTY